MITRRLTAALARSPKSICSSACFEVLEDTLIVRRADPFARTPKHRLVQHPKFYFSDVGVRNGLLGSFDVSADHTGRSSSSSSSSRSRRVLPPPTSTSASPPTAPSTARRST